MPIGDYCEKPAATVRESETIRAASQRMKQEGLGSLVVVKDADPLGMVTDRDLVMMSLCGRLDPGAVRVEEVVSRPLVSIDPEAPVHEAIRTMRKHGVRRLPVVDDKRQLVGIVASDDLLSLLARELGGLSVAVRRQSPASGGEGEPEPLSTLAGDHYQKEVVTVTHDAVAREAADAMKEHAVGSVVVLRDEAPVGIVTDRDLLERIVADGRDAGSTSVSDVMSHPLETASPADPLERVVERMAANSIRRIPVVRDDALVGLVTLDDVLVRVAGELHELAEGTRREIDVAQRGARARELARDVGERARDLGGQLEHLGSEAKDRLLKEIEGLRERMRGRKGSKD